MDTLQPKAWLVYTPRLSTGFNLGNTFRTASYILTQRRICTIFATVEAEFISLEAKVAQFVGLCEKLRTENHDLRQQLAGARNDAKRLTERIDGAKVKLENLLARLPD